MNLFVKFLFSFVYFSLFLCFVSASYYDLTSPDSSLYEFNSTELSDVYIVLSSEVITMATTTSEEVSALSFFSSMCTNSGYDYISYSMPSHGGNAQRDWFNYEVLCRAPPATSGTVSFRAPYIATSNFSSLSLTYSGSSNGGLIVPYVEVNGTSYRFRSGEVVVSIPEGQEFVVWFDLIRLTDESPELSYYWDVEGISSSGSSEVVEPEAACSNIFSCVWAWILSFFEGFF